MAIVFANAETATELMVAGFIMIFFVQVAGNSMQIFASEVFPTNARASGFGWAAGVGRLATAFIMPTILWVQNGWGLTTVFGCLATLLFDRSGVGDAARPGGAAKEPRRDRTADRLNAAGKAAGRSRVETNIAAALKQPLSFQQGLIAEIAAEALDAGAGFFQRRVAVA